jgi:hypothetical protein
VLRDATRQAGNFHLTGIANALFLAALIYAATQ